MSTLHTQLCDLLGIQYPIIQAPMAGGMTTPELVAAVCEAGALGSFAASRLTSDQVLNAIGKIKSLTDKPFAVNFLVALPEHAEGDVAETQEFLDQFRQRLGIPSGDPNFTLRPSNLDEQIQMVLDEGVPILSTALGDPSPYIERAHAKGTKIIAMATTVDEAIHCEQVGCDAVVAQGAEAGGHRSTFQLGPNYEGQLIGGMALTPQVADAVNIAVVATGGIGDGRGLIAALALGASGVQIGTRFLLAREAATIAAYRERLLNAKENDTVITRSTSGRPTRSIRNQLIDAYRESGVEPLPFPLQGQVIADVFTAALARGAADYFPLQAGQGLRLLKDKQSASEIINEIIGDARAIISRWCEINSDERR